MGATLRCDNLVAGYKDFKVTNVNFALKEGQILCLAGKSGSGKSTIFKTILGQLRPLSGFVSKTIGERSANLRIGYSPQRNALLPYLTLEENIALFARMTKVDSVLIKARTKKIIHQLGLQGHAKKQARKLSGGMQKRADLACALIHEPQVLLVDEPFAGLDQTAESFVWQQLKSRAQEGLIILLITHRVEEAHQHCTDFGLISDGRYIGDQVMKQAMQHFTLSQIIQNPQLLDEAIK